MDKQMEKIIKELHKFKTIAIYGAIGTGKTSLAYKLISNIDKKVYFFKHPKPDLIEEMGYENIDSLERMELIQDSVLYIDEPQLHFSIQDKKSNTIIAQICSLSRQLGITLIISTSDTRVFGKANEAFFDTWIVKDLDYDMIKNGSKIKKIMQKNAVFHASGIRLQTSEFLFENRNNPELNGLHSFEKLNAFTEEHSKPFRKIATNNAPNNAPKIKLATEKNTENTSVTLQSANPEAEQVARNCEFPPVETQIQNEKYKERIQNK